MSQELCEALSKLTVKDILNHFKEKLSFSRTQRCSNNALVMHVLTNASREDLELMRGMVVERESGQEIERQEREASRKCHLVDQKYTRQVAARLEADDIDTTETSSLMISFAFQHPPGPRNVIMCFTRQHQTVVSEVVCAEYVRIDEPPHQIRSYTLIFSLFLHFPYVADPPLHTSALTRLHAITLALARQSHSLPRTDLTYLMDI